MKPGKPILDELAAPVPRDAADDRWTFDDGPLEAISAWRRGEAEYPGLAELRKHVAENPELYDCESREDEP